MKTGAKARGHRARRKVIYLRRADPPITPTEVDIAEAHLNSWESRAADLSDLS